MVHWQWCTGPRDRRKPLCCLVTLFDECGQIRYSCSAAVRFPQLPAEGGDSAFLWAAVSDLGKGGTKGNRREEINFKSGFSV